MGNPLKKAKKALKKVGRTAKQVFGGFKRQKYGDASGGFGGPEGLPIRRVVRPVGEGSVEYMSRES